MRDAFVARLVELAASDTRVMLVTGDLGFGAFDAFRNRFPRQFLNVGVAEQNMIGVATGLALKGRTVFAYSIANFATLRCLEQIRNDAAYHRANVKVVAMGGGFSYGALGMTHHATEDLSIMRALPGVTVVAPGDAWEASEATAAIARSPGVCFLRLDRTSATDVLRVPGTFELGRARRVREGTAVTLVACGGILSVALEAAKQLALEETHCRVVSMHTLKPLDGAEILRAAAETGGIVTIEENSVDGGLGGAIAEVCLESGIRPRTFRRVGLRGGFASVVGSQNYLRKEYMIDVESVVNQVRECNLENPS